MSFIEISSARKVYPNGVAALHGLDLSAEEGELVVLVGPSGCGKSTLLRMIAGLETITSGTVSLAGRVINDMEPGARDIAMVFQNYALYPHMSVRGNMEYVLKNKRMPRDQIADRIGEAARILEIEAFLDRRPAQLSGGQRQRVAMGRAIVRQPRAFLFDEPLSNLDARLRSHMRVEIRALQKRLGTTAIYVTHDQLEAMTLADRLVVMNAGRIEQIGRPEEVYERPHSLFVASFMGAPAMNLLPAGLAAIRASELEIDKACSTVGFRPEHVHAASPAGQGLRLAARVLTHEPTGADTLVHLRIPGHDGAITMRAAAGFRPVPDTEITLTIAWDALHFFAAESGRRMEMPARHRHGQAARG